MSRADEKRPVYREVQRFRQVWVWALVIPIAGLMWYSFAKQLLLHHPLRDNLISDIRLFLFWLAFGIGLPALFVFGRLITEVREDGIYIRFVPFHRRSRKIPFKDLKEYQVRTYRPILDYGGWGIRCGLKGKAYTVSGNRGVQLELTSGERLLVGSQRPEELWQAIRAQSDGR